MQAVKPPAQPPNVPLGPPPAEMAPPPPLGPPPDLPLDRAELKRAVEDSTNSPVQSKRMRSVNSLSDVTAASESGGYKRGHAGFSTDGDSSSSTSDQEDAIQEGRDTDLGGPTVQHACNEVGLEASYTQSPPSARWVWDRFLQQDRQHASTAVLEKRMLQALDALSFGGDEHGSEGTRHN